MVCISDGKRNSKKVSFTDGGKASIESTGGGERKSKKLSTGVQIFCLLYLKIGFSLLFTPI